MRKGQEIFSFLQWLQEKGICNNLQSKRMGDPFHLSDEEWGVLWKQFKGESRK